MRSQGLGPSRWGRPAPAVLAAAMVAAALLLLWEGRGQTFFVDEWSFGYIDRAGLSPGELLSPDNGHLALVPILITKTSLALFGAGTALPLRLVSVALHLTVAGLVFALARRAVGDLVALAPALLVLFLGSASDLLVGSHGMPMLLAVASGLGAWLAVAAGTGKGDVLAAALLAIGLASNGLALLFLAGAAALILLAPRRSPRRLWLVFAPLALYAIWQLAYGGGEGSGATLANFAGIPAFAFDSLGAELAALTGLFTQPGAEVASFDSEAGLALAGGLVVAVLALVLAGYRHFPRAAIPAALGLLALWALTGAVASPARQPFSARYLYPGVILLLLIAAEALAASPQRRRGALILVGVCAVGLLPNLREIHYGATFFRQASDQDRAVLAAADLLGPGVPATLPLGIAGEPGAVADPAMTFSLGAYREARDRHGSPAYSPAQLEAADPASREAADRLLVRALPITLGPATAVPAPLLTAAGAEAEGGTLRRRHGCLLFTPTATPGYLRLALPPRGLWARAAAGPPVAIALRRYGDGFIAAPASAPAGHPFSLSVPVVPAAREWQAQLTVAQPVAVCGLGRPSV